MEWCLQWKENAVFLYMSYFKYLAKTCPLCGLPILSIERLTVLKPVFES